MGRSWNGTLTHTRTQVGPTEIMLSARNQTQERTYYIVPFTWASGIEQTNLWWKKIKHPIYCLWQQETDWETIQGNSQSGGNVLYLGSRCWGCGCMHLPKLKFLPSNLLISLYIHFTSIKKKNQAVGGEGGTGERGVESLTGQKEIKIVRKRLWSLIFLTHSGQSEKLAPKLKICNTIWWIWTRRGKNPYS